MSYHWRTLFTACFAAFVWRLDLYGVTISLPSISHHFGVGTDTVVLVVVCYSLFLSSSLLLVGRIEDILGVKRVLIWGFLIFALGALCAGLSTSIAVLIFARSVQGIAGAGLISSVYALVSQKVPVERRGSAFGLISASAALGISMGTPLGGMITGWFSWRGVFLLDVCLGLLGAAAAFRTIPFSGKKKINFWSSLDMPGAVMSVLSVFLVLFALNRVNGLGWDSPFVLGGFLVSAISGMSFILWEKRSSSPLVDLSIIKSRKLIFTLLVGMLMFASLSGNAVLMPFYLEMIEGMKPQLTGGVFLIYSIVFAFTSLIVGKLADRVAPRLLVTVALLIGVVACLFFSAMLNAPGNLYCVIFLFLLGLSVGAFLPPNNQIVMGHAPEGAKGVFSSLYNTFNNLGWALGACLSEAVFSIYLSGTSVDATQRSASQSFHLAGFRNAYVLVGGLILGSLIISIILLAKRSSDETTIVERGQTKEA